MNLWKSPARAIKPGKKSRKEETHMKKLITLVLTLALALSLTVPAFAAGTTTTATATPSGIGVILNGKAVTFPDAEPVLKDGRTMVPYRALMEALGGKVSYADGGVISCELNGTTLTFTLGANTVTATTGEKTETIQMDVPCFYKDGRTYVPVRFFAQALGYDVMWDGDDRAAVLVDKDALIDEIDQNFTVLNATLQKLQRDPTKNYESTATYNISMNLDDGTGTPVSADLKMNLTMISSATVVEMKGTLDASSLITALDLNGAVESGAISAAEAALLSKSLSSITFEMIVNLDEDMLYIKIPLLDTLLSGGTGSGTTENWYKLSLGLKEMGVDVSSLSSADTVGKTVYAFCRAVASMDNTTAGDLYDNVQSTGAALVSFLGDSSAKKSGSTYTWTLDKAALDKLLGAAGSSDETFQSFTVTLTADPNGVLTYTVDIKTVADSSGQSMGISGNMTVNATGAKLTMKLDMGSMGSAEYNLSMTMTPTTATPATQPPDGATIVDLGGLTGGTAESTLVPTAA